MNYLTLPMGFVVNFTIPIPIQGTKISGDGRMEIIEKSASIETIEHCPYNCDTGMKSIVLHV